MLAALPVAFIVSLIALFTDARKGYAIGGFVISAIFGLWFIGLPLLVRCWL